MASPPPPVKASLQTLLAKIRAHTQHERLLSAAIANVTHMTPEEEASVVLPDQHLSSLHAALAIVSSPSLSLELELLLLAQPLCVVAVASYLCACRELQALWLLVGTAIQALVGAHLRQLFQGPRPEAAHSYGLYDYGMPCERAQTVTFVAAYVLLVRWCGPTPLGPLGKVALVLAGMGTILAVCAAGVHLGVVSREQVADGAGLGMLLSLPWYVGFHRIFRPLLAPLLKGGLCHRFYLRDSSHLPDIAAREFEWYSSLTQAKDV